MRFYRLAFFEITGRGLAKSLGTPSEGWIPYYWKIAVGRESAYLDTIPL
jgi:hypothetical protein